MEKLSLDKFANEQIESNQIIGGKGSPVYEEPAWVACLRPTGSGVTTNDGTGQPFSYDEHQDYDCDGEINGNDSLLIETHPGTGN